MQAVSSEVQAFGDKRLAPGMYTVPRFSCDAFEGLSFKMDGTECGFYEAYSKLRDSKIKEMPKHHHPSDPDIYVTETGEVHVMGKILELDLLRRLLELVCGGIDPFGAMWFPYDWEVSSDADVAHGFFLTYAGKIVNEHFSFFSCDPFILRPCHLNGLEKSEDYIPSWRSWSYSDSAFACYWYRKFYTETITGQLMVLRPDEPQIYLYPEARAPRSSAIIEAWLSDIRGVLAGIRISILILVVLVLIDLLLRFK